MIHKMNQTFYSLIDMEVQKMNEFLTVVFYLIAIVAAVGPIAIAAYYDSKEKQVRGANCH